MLLKQKQKPRNPTAAQEKIFFGPREIKVLAAGDTRANLFNAIATGVSAGLYC